MNKLLLKSQPLIMGIINVTPDSFSDGGQFETAEAAIAQGLKLISEGAHILDIGGESTRPGSVALSPDEEIARIVPVIRGLKGKVSFISVDTRNAQTMRAAIEAGANMINDISGLTHDRESLNVAAASDFPVCLMHMKGTPQDMQKNPYYEDVVEEVFVFFEERITACLKAGIRKDNIILDVGIGFGKTVHHNVELLKYHRRFQDLGCPLMLGVSRKSFIGTLSKQEKADERLAGSLAAALWGMQNGADILRVHDVKETAQAVAVYQAIAKAG